MLYIGCSQWNYSFWKGDLYPATRSQHVLNYYSRKFGCVEMNSTYHDRVEDMVMINWQKNVTSLFRFCPKFPKTISHENKLLNVEKLTDDFIDSVSLLQDNLGISFLQLPLNMSPENNYLLDNFLAYINNRIQVSVEIRPDWLSRPDVLKECLTILKKHKAGVVIVDGAETVQYMNSIKLTNPTAFIRFLSYDHPTDRARIDDWVNMIKVWQDKGVKDIYFILHFSDKPNVPAIIEYAMERLL